MKSITLLHFETSEIKIDQHLIGRRSVEPLHYSDLHNEKNQFFHTTNIIKNYVSEFML